MKQSYMLNFGPYQYVVTIPSRTGSIEMFVVAKQLSLNTFYTVPMQMSRSFLTNLGGGQLVNLKYYFGVGDCGLTPLTYSNFQSYYLLVDPCMEYQVSASNNCSACLKPDYYLHQR